MQLPAGLTALSKLSNWWLPPATYLRAARNKTLKVIWAVTLSLRASYLLLRGGTRREEHHPSPERCGPRDSLHCPVPPVSPQRPSKRQGAHRRRVQDSKVAVAPILVAMEEGTHRVVSVLPWSARVVRVAKIVPWHLLGGRLSLPPRPPLHRVPFSHCWCRGSLLFRSAYGS